MSEILLKSLFERYVQNWNLVKNLPGVHVEPDVDNIFMCPLCFKLCSQKGLETKLISLEHVPPRKLGGKVRTLTCTECNNSHGSELDSQLIQKLKVDDFFSGTSEISQNVRLRIEDHTIRVEVSMPELNHWIMYPIEKQSHPKEVEAINRSFQEGKVEQLNLSLRLFHPSAANAALLRIGYLWAFSILGYGFLLNPTLQLVRSQIHHPTESILKTWGITEYNFPNEFIGLNMIEEPKEMRSFLVVFDLQTTRNKSRRYGVILPGPINMGTEIYDQLSTKEGKEILFNASHLTQEIDFNETPLVAHKIWDD
jgi:hypothetical protein